MIATAMLIVPAYILSITLPGVTVVFSLTGAPRFFPLFFIIIISL